MMLPTSKRNESPWASRWFNDFFGDDCPLIFTATMSPNPSGDGQDGGSAACQCWQHEFYY